jgi:NAD-dependent SIR2 family protein deacetylase
LWQIGAWFNSRLLGKPNENGSLPQLVQSLASGVASRAQAAELFSTLQAAQNSDDWQKFSRGFLNGDKFGDRVFPGLLNAKPSRAHQYLARQLAFRKAYVISLNFDGLTVNALLDLNESKHKGVALHSQQQVTAYFTATRGEFLPAVIKARGDVFYARCADPLCPASNEDHPLDRQGTSSELRCSACRQEKLRLQFSFPGFREKEEAARGILCEAMRFLAQRLSGIIILGLSGRWDSYLLDFVFHHAVQRGLVVADVKPNDEKNQDDALIQSFRSIYYPSCRELTADPPTDEAAFVRIRMDADHFCEKLDDL